MSRVSFMVIGLPRSGTTWAANWLTQFSSLCIHDPLYRAHYTEWEYALGRNAQGKTLGVSCTGVWRWPDWVNKYKARKLILHRDLGEIETSMSNLNMPSLDLIEAQKNLRQIDGMHVHWLDLFNPDTALHIWKHLITDLPFSRPRHDELTMMKIEPMFTKVPIDKELMSIYANDSSIQKFQI